MRMKFIFVSIFMLSVVVGFSQITGGGSKGTTSSSKTKTKGQLTALGNCNYIKFSYVMPFGDAGATLGSRSGLNDFVEGNALGAKSGFGMEYGSNSYFDGLDFVNNLAIGLKFSLGASITLNNWENEIEMSTYPMFMNLDIGLGPIATYELMSDMSVSGYVKVSPTGMFITPGEQTYYNSTLDMKASIGWGVKTSIGFEFNYNTLMLGLDLNLGKIKHNYKYAYNVYDGLEDDYLGYYEDSYENIEEEVEIKVPNNMLVLSIGFRFPK